ncbi:flagellar protein FliT [Andreprevotia lacus]|uniref:flagellar protein FliT n=1 Tax=Andreprevotia lacus TaxID=1121000 RepID=UPI0015938F09|nr:flagellar protein FliT [Andreprevotia lacus]
MPDVSIIVQAMHALAARFNEAVSRGDWQAVFDAMPQWQVLQGQLRDIDWQAMAPAQRDALAQSLRNLQTLVDGLAEHAEAWRPELAALLQGSTTSSKLQQAYR